MSFTANISRMSTPGRSPGNSRSLDLKYLIRLRANPFDLRQPQDHVAIAFTLSPWP
jgi:hypothetical protein